MDALLELFKTDVAVAVAWVCTVVSTIFCFVKNKENKCLKVKLQNLEIKISNLSNDAVSLAGEKNIYTKHNSGGMKINM